MPMIRTTRLSGRLWLAASCLALGLCSTVAIAWFVALLPAERHNARPHQQFDRNRDPAAGEGEGYITQYLATTAATLTAETVAARQGPMYYNFSGNVEHEPDWPAWVRAIVLPWRGLANVSGDAPATATAASNEQPPARDFTFQIPRDWPSMYSRESITLYAAGWPFLALHGSREQIVQWPPIVDPAASLARRINGDDGTVNVTHGLIDPPSWLKNPRRISQLDALPYAPLWTGFAADTAIFSAVWWVLLNTPRFVVRRYRRRRGACLECGYNRAGLTTEVACPECGRAA